ncbi:hypothetical protein [Thermocrinis minervae]|uniref:Uncharacterized protein n=1 Tax=Thermocrinis minervae TaxID=381751 RepID=A0A1M6QN56_9AQUI|nr:hypothetical protein [Thermocrinis minervae]SHK21503.1 hypothetical protein SAMN05444391_0302 [Thermocrinis minervae]
MEFFFFPDVYADTYLIDYYVISFNLNNKDLVVTREWEGREYIVEVLDVDEFLRQAKDVVLFEFGDEVERFSNLEEALRHAYRLAYTEAKRRSPKEILPAMGVGCPPLDLIRRTFPVEFKLDPFPKDLTAYLENIVRSVPKDMPKKETHDEGNEWDIL